jgi:hypothetical protein
MSTISLVEAMNTRYIINSLLGRFVGILNNAAESGDTIDFAGAKLGPEAASILRNYTGTVDMINSTDEYLNSILLNNRERLKQIEEYEVLDLTDTTTLQVYSDLVKSIPKGAKICPKVSLVRILDKATLILLILSRPDVEFDIRSCASDIYTYVRTYWLPNAKHHDKYYELIAPDTVVRDKTDKGSYGSAETGYLKEDAFIQSHVVVPYEFGNTPIIDFSRGKVDEEWDDLVAACLNAFKSNNVAKESGKVLRNILTFREE